MKSSNGINLKNIILCEKIYFQNLSDRHMIFTVSQNDYTTKGKVPDHKSIITFFKLLQIVLIESELYHMKIPKIGSINIKPREKS